MEKEIEGDARLKLPINEIVCGDCLKVMKDWPDNCVDTIITDPPYGIGFMGKEWDTFKPENIAEAMEKDKRSHTGIASQRTSNTAGSYDFSRNQEFQQWFTVWGIEALRVLKPGGTLLIFGGTRTYHRLACGIEDAGFILKDCIMWLYGSGFPKATDISKQLDKGHKRKQGKLRTDGRGASPQKINNHRQGDTGIGHADGSKQQYHETLPTTPEAKLWDGWKSHGLKPAYEPILVAMKPNDGSYANNALKHGVSGLNIDGGRIGTDAGWSYPNGRQGKGCFGKESLESNLTEPMQASQGRFPANVILDEEAGAMLDEQSGVSKRGKTYDYTDEKEYQVKGFVPDNKPNSPSNRGDSGGASRFFYCAKASKAERNAGCERLNKKHSGSMVANEGKTMHLGEASLKNEHKQIQAKYNHHPTVKPLALMEYLCILTKTPTGGIVLDPFAGSCSTGIAAHRVGRSYIMIEKEKEYCEIGARRLQNEKNKMSLFENNPCIEP